MVRLDQTVRQVSDVVIPCLTKERCLEFAKVYFKRLGGIPPADQDPSEELLTAFEYLLKVLNHIYVDLAVWAPYQMRHK